MEPVADQDGASVLLIDRGQDVATELSVGLVAVLLRPNPIQVLHVVGDDERGAVLTVLDAAYLLAADAYPVVEDAVHRLPVLVALQRRFRPRVVDFLVLEVPVVAED